MYLHYSANENFERVSEIIELDKIGLTGDWKSKALDYATGELLIATLKK